MEIYRKKLLLKLIRQCKASNISIANLLEQNSNFNLQKQIESYFSLSKEIEQKKKQLQKQLLQMQTMDKSLKNKFSKIEKYMAQYDISQKRVHTWVARLRTVAKYKRIQPDYKDMWGEALTKVNQATRKVLQSILTANVEVKKSATKIQLELLEQGLLDIVKGLIQKFGKLFTKISQFSKISKNLPKISS